jgi:nucleoside phosphorylase
MLLITFAHKAEAQEFINRKHNIPVEFYFPGIYRHEDEILLLSGSGIDSAMIKSRQVIEYFGNKISGLLNMGIAGALRDSLQINQIYGINRIYCEDESEYFTTNNPRPQIDCISVDKTIADDNRARVLAKNAQCVDMELWGFAKIANEFKISIRSYKLISDYVSDGLNLTEIKNNAPIYSRHLFDFYKKLPL